MKVYSFSQARQRLSELLDVALKEEVIVKRRNGETFSISYKKKNKSPLDVHGVKTKITTKDIIDSIRESRSR